MTGIFMDKSVKPSDRDLLDQLGPTFPYWFDLKLYLHNTLVNPTEAWHYSGKRYGWIFRIRSKNMDIIHLLPRKDYFQALFVFGKGSIEKILESNIHESTKRDIRNMEAHNEGFQIRIDVNTDDTLQDLRKLIQTKINS